MYSIIYIHSLKNDVLKQHIGTSILYNYIPYIQQELGSTFEISRHDEHGDQNSDNRNMSIEIRSPRLLINKYNAVEKV